MTNPAFTSAMPTMPVKDLVQAIAFYDSIGFQTDFRNGALFAIVRRDQVEIGLAPENIHKVPAGTGRCYIKLASGIDAFYADLKAKGIDIRHPLQDEKYGMRECMIADPDQNLVNFGQPL
jgi:catechol 2,3-dioxygenase-like lactoylglutathione lyase family enzyme